MPCRCSWPPPLHLAPLTRDSFKAENQKGWKSRPAARDPDALILMISPGAAPRPARRPRLLNRGTGHIPIRTKDATIALGRAQNCLAARAIVKILASDGRHRLHRNSAAVGAEQFRSEFHHAPPSRRISGVSINAHAAETDTSRVAAHSVISVERDGCAIEQSASRRQARLLRM